MKKMKQSFYWLVFFILITGSVSANDIALTNVNITGEDPGNHCAMVTFDVSWKNSWRTSSAPANYDAAWLFVKYRINGGAWNHATLNSTGHTTPAGSEIIPAGDGTGCIIRSSSDGAGPNAWTSGQLRWNYGVDGVGDNASVEVRMFAIEMVYIPQGSFVLGSGGTEEGAFYTYPTTTQPYTVNGEGAITIGTAAGNLYYPPGFSSGAISGDQTGILPPAFPKGYNAFYCMKYEISQQQYVDFLNCLSTVQAPYRYAASGSTDRYGISVASGVYSTTLPNVACNNLSWDDQAAYFDWSCMRPMTELEFEKACRGPEVVPNGYAWGTVGIAGSAYSLNNSGTPTEVIGSNYKPDLGNACYSATYSSGPLRVGIFAGSSGNTGRLTAGASYYGVMELSGNLVERAVSVGNTTGRAFTGIHGNGILDGVGSANVSFWPATFGLGAGFHGGSFQSGPNFLQVSDRGYAAYPENPANPRYSNYGGRGVRVVP